MSDEKYNVLILGASYGSLLASKLILAGHNATLICLPEEVELINKDGIHVRMPVRGRDDLVEIHSKDAPGKLNAAGPGDVDPADYDLVALAMQEPQYRSDGVRQLLAKVAGSGKPCMSIMNMPPLPYMLRLPGIEAEAIKQCYTDPTVWDGFDSDLVTLASPDPQAFRPPEEPVNVLQVSLPTNFKVARFASDEHTAMLRKIEQDILDIRFDPGDGNPIELPVKLRVYDSIFVPLAKWAMLMTGNYRCVQEDAARSIKEAVHSNLDASKEVYDWVHDLCQKLGADAADMVPFEKYANAAQGLSKPSSAARALFAGAPNIERLDLLVKTLSDNIGMQSKMVEDTVDLVNKRLQINREANK
ncbi:MAG: hypothetical protein ACFE0S_06100 [Rhodospirillales bacterium]